MHRPVDYVIHRYTSKLFNPMILQPYDHSETNLVRHLHVMLSVCSLLSPQNSRQNQSFLRSRFKCTFCIIQFSILTIKKFKSKKYIAVLIFFRQFKRKNWTYKLTTAAIFNGLAPRGQSNSGTLQCTIHSSSQPSSDHRLKYLVYDFDLWPWGQGHNFFIYQLFTVIIWYNC